jgi:RimJ/RimL family protein N-acetyltransferase
MKRITERLLIKPISRGNEEAMFKYRSDPETNKYLSLIPKSVDDVAEFINKASLDINVPGTWFQLAIIEQATNQLIGDVGIHFLNSDSENKEVEIGYAFDKEFRGKGFATEALTEIIDYLFSSLKKHRIIASIDPTNLASIRLVERLGFRKEAHFIEGLYFQGRWVDNLIYAVLAREWRTKALNFI